MKRVPAKLAVLLLHQEADARGDEQLRVTPGALRNWVYRGHITRGPGGYDLREILEYLERRERTMQAGTHIACPVDDCDWKLQLDDEPPSVMPDLAADAFRERALGTDVVLRQHFESHDVLDWVNTVQRLKVELWKCQDAATIGRDRSASQLDSRPAKL